MSKTQWTFGTVTVQQGRKTRSQYAQYGRLWDVTCTCGFSATLGSKADASHTARSHRKVCAATTNH